MRVLVCGGRDFTDKDLMFDFLDKHEADYGPYTVIQGGARGADALAKEWANDLNLPVEEYKADWLLYGKAAGPIRNKQMLDEGKPDLVIAFPGGRGTQNMIQQAIKAGVKVITVEGRI